MKQLTHLFFLLILNTYAQNDSISTVATYGDEVDRLFENISFRGGLGLFMPASKQHFTMAPFFEFNMNIPTSKVNSVEFAVQFGGWDRLNNFTYIKRQDTLKGTSRLFINGLLKFKRDVLFFDTSFIGIGVGVGISTIFINTDEDISQTPEEELIYSNMTSFILSPELEYLFDISERTQFSISFSVQYATYKLKPALENDIGKWYFLPKLGYRF